MIKVTLELDHITAISVINVLSEAIDKRIRECEIDNMYGSETEDLFSQLKSEIEQIDKLIAFRDALQKHKSTLDDVPF